MRLSSPPPLGSAAYNPAVHRFYAPAFEAADQTVALPEDEAQHLVRVLRVDKGREVLVFNGRGHQCRAQVELADKRGVLLRVTGVELPAPELPFELTLAQAALKGDKTDDVVRAWIENPVFGAVARRVVGPEVSLYRAMLMNKAARGAGRDH